MIERDFDVIVVGAGGAGLSAAIAARAAGASVMVLEADTKPGGATRFSTGVVYAAGTKTQRAVGITDDADALYTFVMALNQHAVSPALTRYYADHAAAAVDWLAGLGVSFPISMLIESCVSGVRRGHTPSGFGLEIVDMLVNHAGAIGVETALGVRVEGLILEDGVVRGVRAQGTALRAAATIVATGGFGNNPEMIARLFPSAAYHGDRVWAVHRDAKFILGDGITLGEQVGAAIAGYDHGLIMPSACFSSRNMEAFLPPWVVAVNREGRRFMAEWESYCVVGDLISAQTAHRCWAIFDHAALLSNDEDTSYTDPYASGHIISSWERNSILKEVAKGVVAISGSLAELAAKIGVDAIALAETVRVYNADVTAGADLRFNKKGNGRPLPPVQAPPYYAVEVRPAIIGWTGAGLDTDARCQVLDRHGRAIGGLYAVGEIMGAFHGTRYGGGGMSVGGGVIFGRRAGEEAAALARAV